MVSTTYRKRLAVEKELTFSITKSLIGDLANYRLQRLMQLALSNLTDKQYLLALKEIPNYVSKATV